jgi:hypothetical protein
MRKVEIDSAAVDESRFRLIVAGAISHADKARRRYLRSNTVQPD